MRVGLGAGAAVAFPILQATLGQALLVAGLAVALLAAATFLVAGIVIRTWLIRGTTQDRRQLTRFVEDVLRARPVEGLPGPL